MADWQAGFKELTSKPHSAQAQWWLNGFWNAGADKEAETIWKIAHTFMEIDAGQPVLYGKKTADFKETCDLDEFKAHVALEKLGETLTVQALRKRLKALDIDSNNRMALSEYLLDKYKKTPQALVNSPQGTLDRSIIDEAQAKCDEAQALLDKATEAKRECDIAEAPLKKANEELATVVAEIAALEKAKADKLEELDRIINGSDGAVKKGKATQEKAQLQSEDPLPLRKAKITQEAALKRVEKARAPFTAATEAAEAARQAAEQAFVAAQAALDELKKKGGTPHGTVWWMERVLNEKLKFMPKK
jgi:chromosome segregation ATPase